MRFELSQEQRGFGAALADLLRGADVVTSTRAWAAGERAPGLELWSRLAEQGVTGLVVPEHAGGLGGSMVDLCVAFEQLGRYAVSGPWAESAAYLPAALEDEQLLGMLAEGAVGSVAVRPSVPHALDGDTASLLFVVEDGVLRDGTPGAVRHSVDPSRRLVEVRPGEEVGAADLSRAFDQAALATSAQLLGLGEHLLATTVTYVTQRRQFGREIGSYQAVKHRLADLRIALDFVRPLVFGAAVLFEAEERSRDVAAATVAASEGAWLAARTALQLHGAIGYTAEHDLSLSILKTRALHGAWGTPAQARRRVLASLATGAPDA